ncbi:hypothetical protein E4T56_gene7953 [Termitomyces sp. T112]|nr:hypothetical protein E4T56_gene7953 [Termitomyces sp. T112]
MLTPGNSNASSANPNGPLANSNTFSAAIDASPASPEPLGPSPTVSDTGICHQFDTLVYLTSSGASQQPRNGLLPQTTLDLFGPLPLAYLHQHHLPNNNANPCQRQSLTAKEQVTLPANKQQQDLQPPTP